jgi:hypothetical protein
LVQISEASESSSEQDVLTGDKIKNPSRGLMRALDEHSVRLDLNW